MKVSVLVQGHLKQYRPEGHFELDVPDSITVRTLIEVTGIPWEEVGLAAVNGAMAAEEAVLHEGDQVTLLAPLEGG